MTHMWKKATDGPSDLPRMLHPHFPRKPTTILVVEDNPDDAELIAAVLATGLSYTQVDVAFTGEKARDYLRQRDLPTLITLDLFLPDTHGLEILEWMGSDDCPENISIQKSETRIKIKYTLVVIILVQLE